MHFSGSFSCLCSRWVCGVAVPPGHSVPWAPAPSCWAHTLRVGPFCDVRRCRRCLEACAGEGSGLCGDLQSPHNGVSLCCCRMRHVRRAWQEADGKGCVEQSGAGLSPGAEGQVFGSLGEATGATHLSPVAIHLSCLHWLAGTSDSPAGFPPSYHSSLCSSTGSLVCHLKSD